jgi:mannose-6-phosphate isomerase
MNAPLRFEPYLRPLIWGGRRLGEALGKPLPTGEAYGESWEVSDHPAHRSRLAGAAPARTLRDLMEHDRDALLGRAAPSHPVFPWLVKYLDARDWLSVQVHPDDAAAARLCPGEGGKTEAWFVLDADPGSRVYAGLRPGVDEARLRRALAEGTVADCLHSFAPRLGDCLFLRAGTVHAVGGGVLLAEVQQTSDATFRLYDWDRVDAHGKRRPLHVEQALACIDWRAGPANPVRTEGYASGAAPVRQPLAECEHFRIDYLCDDRPFACGGTGRVQVLTALRGRGHLAGEPLRPGQTCVLPAAMPEVPCEPDGPLALLVATLPDPR